MPTPNNSQLDEMYDRVGILPLHRVPDSAKLRDQLTVEIKGLMLELIGQDEAPDTHIQRGTTAGKPAYSLRAWVINQKLTELRRKVDAL